jgi:hypothetical protein
VNDGSKSNWVRTRSCDGLLYNTLIELLKTWQFLDLQSNSSFQERLRIKFLQANMTSNIEYLRAFQLYVTVFI